MNTDNFLIDNSDIEMAQNICKMITNTEVRNRAVANAIAGSIAAKFFDTEKYDVDSESGLHNIGTVLEDIDISDIYINGNYFDARVFFNEEEMSIPAAHFKNNLLPTAYMFIKINADLSGATVIGFVNPENVKMMNSVDGYYHINEDDLESFYDIEPLIVTVEDSVEVSDKDIFAFIDNSLEDKNSFYAELLKSKEGRIKLAKAIKAQNIFKFVSIADNNNIEANEIEENIPDFGFGDSPEISFESSGDLDLLSEENIDDLSLENPIVDDLEPRIDTLDSIEETSDLIDLEEKDIDFDKQEIRFHQRISEVDGKSDIRLLPGLKNDDDEKIVTGPAYLFDMLDELIKENKKIRWKLNIKKLKHYFIFDTKQDGTLPRGSYLYKKFKRFTKRHNFRHIRFHDIRHTSATYLLSDPNMTPKELQKRLGHRDFNTTMNVYGHVLRKEKDTATTAFENLLKKVIFKVNNYDELVNLLTSKRYTKTRIQRMLLHILMNNTKEEMKDCFPINYLHILKMNQNGQNYLKTIKKTCDYHLITTLSSYTHPALDLEIKSSKLLSLIDNQILKKEFQNIPIIELSKR